MTVTINNMKRVFPTFSLSVGTVDENRFKFTPYYVPLVRAHDQATRTLEAVLSTRGMHSLEEVYLRSRYPFGFILKGRRFPVGATCVAFPEILPTEALDVAITDVLGSLERLQRGHGMDLYMIRDYQPSDSSRHVDWKASAKTASLKTREFAADESRNIVLTFDRYGKAGDEERFEGLVSQAASLAFYLSNEGAEVTLLSDDWSSPPGRSANQLQSISSTIWHWSK